MAAAAVAAAAAAAGVHEDISDEELNAMVTQLQPLSITVCACGTHGFICVFFLLCVYVDTQLENQLLSNEQLMRENDVLDAYLRRHAQVRCSVV